MNRFLNIFLLLASLAFSKEIILVQGAMDMEVEHMVKALKDPKKEHIGSWTFWRGQLKEHDVIVSRTEIGLVNAAAATTLAIEKYKPTIIINQGTSGGHDYALHTGDIVLGEELVNMGAAKTQRKEEGAAENPRDTIFLDIVQRLRGADDALIEHKSFASDAELLKIAKNTPYAKGKIVEGVIGSADQWNREIERIKFLNSKFKTKSEEMESVAAAQVAKAYGTRFLAIRILSNTELYNEEFDPKTALWCQEFALDVINNIK